MEQKQIIETHWTELKGAIRNRWGKLSDADLEQAKNSHQNLLDLIESKYPNQRNRESLNDVLNFFDFDEEKITPLQEDFYEHHQTAPRSSELSEFQDDAMDIRTRGPERRDFEEKMENVQKNLEKN